MVSPKQVLDLPSIWSVPYRRNPFFTGREDVLTRLHDTLTSGKKAALTQLQAISGLGGIGKTQTAVEYAYQYSSEYQAVLWAKADTREVLVSDFVSIAEVLGLPERNEQNQSRVVNAVKRWLQTNADWLLILDNVEDWEMVDEFIPAVVKGHVLLTTRLRATGTANRVDIYNMEIDEGALFLLHRAKIITLDTPLDSATSADCDKAREISQALDGLPLALDQAGAYIEGVPITLSEYLDLYEAQRTELLKERGQRPFGHNESVFMTFSLSFGRVQQANPAAAELLKFFAFLHPDDIPEEIITEDPPDLGPVLQSIATNPYQLKMTIAELGKYSLVRRDSNAKTLTIHRLVQAVLKDEMDKETQRMWAERTVRVVNQAFHDVEFATWPRCQRCLPHAQTCSSLIDHHQLVLPEAARLLNQAGDYLRQRAQYTDAERLLKKALAIREQVLGPDHSDTAQSLCDLAEFYRAQGRYVQAMPLQQRALAIREQVLGPDHPDTSTSLNTLALLYRAQRQYEQAEPLLKRALAIRERVLGPTDYRTATTLNNLAGLYRALGRYEQAEPLYRRALAIREQALGANHPDTARGLNDLAGLYRDQHRYEQAEPLLKRALAIREQVLGPDHPDTAVSLEHLAGVYRAQQRYEQAEPLAKRALAIREQVLEPTHPDTAISLDNLAKLYRAQGRYEQAEGLLKRLVAIREQVLGPDHSVTKKAQKKLDTVQREIERAAKDHS